METTRNVQFGGAIAALAVPDDSTRYVSNLFMMRYPNRAAERDTKFEISVYRSLKECQGYEFL